VISSKLALVLILPKRKVLPVATLQGANETASSGQIQTFATNLPGTGAQQFVVIGIMGASISVGITSVVLTPNVGSALTLSVVTADTGLRTTLFSGTLAPNANSATSGTVTVTYTSNFSSVSGVSVYTVPLANMSSTTPTSSQSNDATTATTVSTTLATNNGGFIIAIGQSSAAQTTNSVGGTATYTQDINFNGSQSGNVLYGVGAHANGVGRTDSSTVTYTAGASATLRLSSAAWR
jgi:hypothetical protein